MRKLFVHDMCNFDVFPPCCKGVCLLLLYDSLASKLLWLWDVVVDFDCKLGPLGLHRGQFNETHTHYNCFACCFIMVVNNKFSLLLLVWGNHLFWTCSILMFFILLQRCLFVVPVWLVSISTFMAAGFCCRLWLWTEPFRASQRVVWLDLYPTTTVLHAVPSW